jgi:hypothetical protein
MTFERWKELRSLLEDRARYIEHDPALIEALRECLAEIDLLDRVVTRLNAHWAVDLERGELEQEQEDRSGDAGDGRLDTGLRVDRGLDGPGGGLPGGDLLAGVPAAHAAGVAQGKVGALMDATYPEKWRYGRRYEYQSHWFGEDPASRGFLASEAHVQGDQGWRVVAVVPCHRFDPDLPASKATGIPVAAGLLLVMERVQEYDEGEDG